MADIPILSRVEEIIQACLEGRSYNEAPQSRVEYLLIELIKLIETGSTDGILFREWTSGTEYHVGDYVLYGTNFFECTVANSDVDFNPDNWTVIGGGGGASLTALLNTSLTVGGIPSGTSYPAGTTLEQIIRDLLNPVSTPTLTPPSATLSATGAKLLEAGSTLNTTFTLTFNRGKINPAYGTSGYRSGPATGYTFDGETKTTNTFTRTITASKLEYQGSVAYEAGEQPKDSKGNNYSTPLPAGSVNSNKITYEFVDAWWINDPDDPDTIIKNDLISKKDGNTLLTFPKVTREQAEIFDLPASWTLTGIQIYNTISQKWDTITSQFDASTVTHENAAGETVTYTRYTNNLGYGMASRQLKILWSTT